MEVIAHAYDTQQLRPTIKLLVHEEPTDKLNDDEFEINQADKTIQQHQYKQLTINMLSNHLVDQLSAKATARLMKTEWSLANTVPTNIRIHIDGGANRSITNDRNLLVRYRNIKKYPMSGVAAGAPALVCTGLGFIPWKAANGETVFVKCYYSEDAAETIVSPNDIVINHIQDFISWGQYSNVDTQTGKLEFHRRDNTEPLTFQLTSNNGLWYYTNAADDSDYPVWITRCLNGNPTIHRLSKAAEYQLYHLRYGCAGERDLSGVHHHADHQPKLYKHAFFKCDTCCRTAGEYQLPENEDPNIPADVIDWLYDGMAEPEQSLYPGQNFGIDFGFMKGSGYCKKDEEGRTITSVDGYRSYFLIIDGKTRYTWVFLTKTKHPPIKLFEQFLKEHGHPTAHHRTIRCDKGGELWGSQAFRQVLLNAGYILEPTAPQAPYQNGKAERPNRTFGRMVNSLLHNAGLGPEYWSFALLHAVYLKNRRIHRGTNQVPLTQYTGRRPNARRLRIFGCPVVVRNLGKKAAKLDLHTSAGRFLGYTATDKNIIFMDSVTKRIKTATHVVFDEAGMTLPAAELPPYAKMLQQLGYAKDDKEDSDSHELGENNDIQEYQAPTINEIISADVPTVINNISEPTTVPTDTTQMSIQIKCLSDIAKLPTRATDGSVGYDLYSARDVTIPPQTRTCIPLDITIVPPAGTYGQIFSRSGLAAKHSVDVCAGTIDPDYTGNVQVVLENNGITDCAIRSGDRIAQIVFLQAQTPDVINVTDVGATNRGAQGFGSTGTADLNAIQTCEESITSANPSIQPMIRQNTACDDSDPQANDKEAPTNAHGQVEKPFEIFFSSNPFDNTMEIEIPIKGDHPTLGLLTKYCEYRQRVQIKDMAISTPGSRLKCWRTVIRNSYILKFHEFAITSQADLEHAISQVRRRKLLKAKFVIATDKSYGVHPLEGIMQIHFDQLNVIAKHLEDIERERQEERIRQNTITPVIRQTKDEATVPESELPPPELPPLIDDENLAQQFSMKQAMKHTDWPEFKKGQYKQLNQYWEQGMFSYPMPLPRNANALQMLWRFNIKACGTRKSRMVCNGSPRQKGTVTIGHTYANALDAASERLFWAIVAHEGLIAIGADVSNAFAEAPAPKAPLFLYIDDSFRDWWVNHLQREPIPKECNVVRVNNAIQGHPESPRLWEKHIDGILRELGLKPAVHEPCLYAGEINGHRVLFLRQVDDFAVASSDMQTARELIDAINAKMRIDVKHLGIIDRFNGVDVHQTRYYVKITCEKYLHKMIKAHDWLLKGTTPINPIPLPADNHYIRKLEEAVVPATLTEKLQLKEAMGYNYRQVIGEVIFPMMKCRPEIAPHAIKLSQYMENPATEHYQAIRELVAYLAATIEDGIYYWRKTPVMELPIGPMPQLHNDNYVMPDNTPAEEALYGYVDSDWGADTRHRKSVSGIILMYAGGVVGYRCKCQDVIAHSSTEAEFAAACDAGKMILFFRSILEDLGFEQKDATVLYEDNNGALLMANAQQPTRRTRHMDIKKFALLDWVEQDLMILRTIKTAENAADGMTKALTRQLFTRHADTIMGRRIPEYVRRSNPGLDKNG